jgi:aryl-alcohol dehydrogenase-like predicted oxidoreductase
MNAKRNLHLGGAQFGKGYGKHINTPELSTFDLNSLLEYALDNGVLQIDLAQNYEFAVSNLSRTDYASEFIYTTKIQYEIDAEREILLKLRCDLELLGIVSYQALLIHNWAALSTDARVAAVKFIDSLKRASISHEVGISVYDTWELDFVDWIPDTVQAPLNFYNREFLANDIARSLKASGTKFVARSIFHQGLLLNPQFKVKFPELEDFITFCKINNFSHIDGALSVYDTQEMFQAIVVGVVSTSQLEEIITTEFSTRREVQFPDSRAYDSVFRDPRKW